MNTSNDKRYTEENNQFLTWETITEQLQKPRLKDTGILTSRFSQIRRTLKENRRHKYNEYAQLSITNK